MPCAWRTARTSESFTLRICANRLSEKFKFQNIIVAWLIYLTTLILLYPFLKGDITAWSLSIAGDYGSVLNSTYLIDLFIVGSIIGSLIVLYAMKLSSYITQKRNGKMIKFQGLLLTFALLVLAAIGMQLWPR